MSEIELGEVPTEDLKAEYERRVESDRLAEEQERLLRKRATALTFYHRKRAERIANGECTTCGKPLTMRDRINTRVGKPGRPIQSSNRCMACRASRRAAYHERKGRADEQHAG